ncbi:MAG TPA: Gfo/Idh/MocA family oxidoreductase [Acidimicrobiales bacterium]|jgi:predicted dehydrogenase|nr:Gfo/Idh/MocA family oxidoreductase [Acidimicrobiales bacterium]
MVALAFAGAGFVTGIYGLAVEAQPDLRVVHVASRSTRSARRRAAQTGGVACGYADLPGGADVVVVATPPALHRREAERAVAGGAVALVQTPLAATLDDADRLVAAAAQGGRVGYAENLVHSPTVVEAVAACRRLGSLTHLELRFAQGRPDWGDHLEPSWGGGALFDLGVHAIALALLAAAPARVVAAEAQLHAGAGLELDDDATLTLVFDSGLRAEVRATWRAPAPTWEAQAAGPDGAVRLELVPHASVEINGVPVALTSPPPGLASPQLHHLGYVAQLEALSADIEAERPPTPGPQLGRHLLDIMCAAYVSARTGREEPVPFTGPRDRTPLQLWRDS